MYHLPLTLETPAANLALDEALLDSAVAGELPGEVLRLWEPEKFFVVLGRSSASDKEVHLETCRAEGVPVLRRSSGGATVVAGPGCLMYAVVLDLESRAQLRQVDRVHRFVLERHAAALAPLVQGVSLAGTSDLTITPGFPHDELRKFSGNSLRLKRNRLLYHGTILYDFPLDRLARWLGDPSRQPAYRRQREHTSFVTNLPVARAVLMAALRNAWQAEEPLLGWPRRRTDELAAGRYAALAW